MNRGLPEMLHCLNSTSSETTEMSVLERQRTRLKWQQQEQLIQQQLGGVFSAMNGDQDLGGSMKPDPGMENGWSDDLGRVLNYGNGPEFQMGCGIPRTLSCPPELAAGMSSAAAGKQNSKKRKADKTQNLKVVEEEKSEEKKMKGCTEEESKVTEQNSNSKSNTTTASSGKNKANNTKENNSKASEIPKPDYIHVRARRGQATDSHSLAERVRREKISERMTYLQDLVPGCNKITGKAGMLDEIINYVQSLQRQVEFLSMKLAAVNPRLDFDIENYLVKESFPGCTIGASSEVVNAGQPQFNTIGQGVSGSCLEMVVNPMDVSLRRTISAPVTIPQAFLDSTGLNIMQQQLTWEDELQNLYGMEFQQGRSASFISQPFTGFLESGHVKLEM